MNKYEWAKGMAWLKACMGEMYEQIDDNIKDDMRNIYDDNISIIINSGSQALRISFGGHQSTVATLTLNCSKTVKPNCTDSSFDCIYSTLSKRTGSEQAKRAAESVAKCNPKHSS